MNAITKHFLEMEDSNKLFDRAIGNFKYWIYIRNDLYGLLRIREGLEYQNAKRRSSLRGIAVGQIIDDVVFKNPLLIAQPSDILFVGFPDRQMIGNEYWDIYLDPLADLFDSTAFLEMWVPRQKHLKPARSKNVYYMDLLQVLSAVHKKKSERLIDKYSVEIKSEARDIYEILDQHIGNVIEEEKIIALLKHRLENFYIRKPVLNELLQKISPKVIVEVCSQATDLMALNEVAAERDIPTIELEHGWMTDDQIVYNFVRKQQISALPDYLFLFSDFVTNVCNFPQQPENVLVTGYPYADMMKRKYPPQANANGILRILVVSTAALSLPVLNQTLDFLNILEEKKVKYHIDYKLHPTEASGDLSTWDILKKYKNVEVIVRQKNLYECFASADIQIGMGSTALIEGLVYNLDTYIFRSKIIDSEEANGLYHSLPVKIVEDANDLYKQIMDRKSHEAFRLSFFKEGAISSMYKAIMNIVTEERNSITVAQRE